MGPRRTAFSWTSVPAGTYGVRAVAYDNSGASASSATATITVGAANTAPDRHVDRTRQRRHVHRTRDGRRLRASASDSDGTVARVEFYSGTTLLNSDTTAPTRSPGHRSRREPTTSRRWRTTTPARARRRRRRRSTVRPTPRLAWSALYSLNEGTGSVAGDSSGVGPAGTVTNATWTAGHFGQAPVVRRETVRSISETWISPAPFTVDGWLLIGACTRERCGSFVMKACDYGFEICRRSAWR